jgi:HEXXH motif-containing protein
LSRPRPRPTQGVLHGFYVFAALDVLFARLAVANGLDGTEVAHVRLPRRDIAAELDVVASALATSYELTDDGRILVEEFRSGGGRETLNTHSP